MLPITTHIASLSASTLSRNKFYLNLLTSHGSNTAEFPAITVGSYSYCYVPFVHIKKTVFLFHFLPVDITIKQKKTKKSNRLLLMNY